MGHGNKDKSEPADPLVPEKTAVRLQRRGQLRELGGRPYRPSITADLDQISQNFSLVRTYHDAGFATTPIIDPTQQAVITWMVANPGMELVMGTNNSALAQGGFGSPWTAGGPGMTSPDLHRRLGSRC